MRTTIRLDEEVAAAAEKLRRDEGISLSRAVNLIARRGLAAKDPARAPFRQRSEHLGLVLDVSNVAEALEVLDGPGFR